jgi:precorrin-2 dehydrogenase/sirohydrochlorin ferrochelatase
MKNKRFKPPVYYPIFLNIQGKKCIVVGGGNVAFRKVKMLLDCGANVTVISPKPHPGLSRLSKQKSVHLIQRAYETGDLKDSVIAIAATDVKEINRKLADEAKKTKTLINVADDPGTSDFIIPSSFRRGKLTIAVSTAGMSPALARKIRTKLERSFGAEYATLLCLIGEVRSEIIGTGLSVSAEAWQEALDLDSLIEFVMRGQSEKAKSQLLRRLKSYPDEK